MLSHSPDIILAASKGIDAFALNVGADAWESSQVANAYNAASKYNGNSNNTAAPFRLFLSFDMSSLPCSSASDMTALQSYIRTYSNNTSTYKYNGRMLVSTFAGESCLFGASTLNQGWINAVKPTTTRSNPLPAIWFVPSFFIDPATFRNLTVIDGAFHVSCYFVAALWTTAEPDSSGIPHGHWVTTTSPLPQTSRISPTSAGTRRIWLRPLLGSSRYAQ